MENNKYYLAVEQIGDAVIITNKNGIIEYVNPAFIKATGFTKKEAIGQTPRVIKSGMHDKSFYDKLWKTILSGRSWRAQLINKKKNGRLFYVDHTITPINDDKNITIGFMGIWKDITKQQDIERLKDEFIGIASHELKTPLTAITVSSQILESGLEAINDEKIINHVKRINSQIKRMSGLVGELLDTTALNEGKMPLVKKNSDLLALIKEAVEDVKEISHFQKIVIEGNVKSKISVDPHRVQEVVSNLLINAVKYSQSRKKIIIKIAEEEKQVVIGITDFGRGIPKKEQNKIFGRYYQVRKLKKQFGPSLGLGLYIAAEIVRLHNGKIWVKSQMGKGTTFFISLPK